MGHKIGEMFDDGVRHLESAADSQQGNRPVVNRILNRGKVAHKSVLTSRFCSPLSTTIASRKCCWLHTEVHSPKDGRPWSKKYVTHTKQSIAVDTLVQRHPRELGVRSSVDGIAALLHLRRNRFTLPISRDLALQALCGS